MFKEKYTCGVDIGSQKIKVSILRSKDGKSVELLGLSEHKTHGFNDASVINLGELSESIHSAISELSRETRLKFKEVHLGICGELIEAREVHAVIPLIDKGHKVIANRDIKNVNAQARLLGIKMEEEILHDLPQSYQVDDANLALNPLGLYGRKLGVYSLMILTDITRVRNITKAVHHAGYDVQSMSFSSYASSKIVLTDEDKIQGSVLLDIGSKATSILVFKENVLKAIKQIELGGDNFTQRIAQQLNLPLDLAEEIKKSYAVALGSSQSSDEEILVKRENEYMPIKRDVICQSIQPVIDDLVRGIMQSLKHSGVHDQINQGITMIGGGALLPGLIERIEEETNLAVQLGTTRVSLSQKLPNGALFSSVIGLAYNGLMKEAGDTLSNRHSHWSKRMTNRIVELYQEYF